ncbi:PTS system beta-glucoside-specific IIB component, Glc family / PTS system beta-glucoside-specific IIA component, Glc family / PTS system beta-glucoside-specific IIC component, Glc family [Arthrobacter sp. FB24]|uniref:beta-glucoside-specific PTS transporter subunit IIABC n=1 Tax=Arthrobacter sp. (strain FB24) TaxID=290399 RepID=UPI0000527A1B|nr:beta-glucoside-specific PTS transporter subunit IIABC [Arthrobacter sp. FB24]ABK03276.1 PTS system beta-glucoside-specific IIB component, Glc family / PTS system beta-glucoside-specific IIA component, Glc family / PTS system beta-glucoside-specific IIC component, Glc family [Arthrobacter sp. FB24]
MTTQESAKAILEHVGGAGNISNLHHCSTRLRFTLADENKTNETALKAIPGVIGVVKGSSQTQVIIGNGVGEIYAAVEKLRGGNQPAAPAGKRPFSWKRLGATIMDFVVSVFTPIIPAIAGSGIFKSLLVLASALGWLDARSENYKLLAVIPDAVFGFIPLLVAYTSAKKLNVNIPLAIGLVGVLVYPAFTALATKDGGIALFGMTVPVVTYTAQVFPAILAVLLLSVVERFFTKITWAPIRVFFVPMMCIVIVAPATIFLLGPLGFWLGTLLTGAMTGLHGSFGWVAVMLLAGVLPLIISVGMHKAFIPPTIATIAATGQESLYQPASLAHNLSEAGATFGVAVRTKSTALRATAISGGISALFGITEPALYGVTLQNRRAFIAVVAGSMSAGAYMGIMQVAGFVAVGPGLASITSFIDAENPQNLLNAVIGLLIAVAVSFTTSLILWRDDASATVRALGDVKLPALNSANVVSPISGDIIALSEVNDPVFSAGILGEGIAIRPTDGAVRAPIAGVVTALLGSKHAIGIRGDDGVEVLVHVGLDTVQLGGSAFTAHVAINDKVEAGQLLLEADLTAITEAGYDTTTPVVIVNSASFTVALTASGSVTAGEPLLSVNEKTKENVNVTA